KQYSRSWISLMPTNLYGPNDNFNVETGHVIPALINKFETAKRLKNPFVKLWGSGNALREFMYVDDLAAAVMFCMNKFDSSQHINIGTGKEISIKNLATLIA
ncbi:MAG: NAD-dependent epimerase/dehydratase family protein, partial [Candidatus Fonsibacter sp.]